MMTDLERCFVPNSRDSEFVKLSVLGPSAGPKSYLADAAKRPEKVFVHKLSA